MHSLCVISSFGANSPLNKNNEELRIKHSVYIFVFLFRFLFVFVFCFFKIMQSKQRQIWSNFSLRASSSNCLNYVRRTKSSVKKRIIVRRTVRSMFGEHTFAQLRTGFRYDFSVALISILALLKYACLRSPSGVQLFTKCVLRHYILLFYTLFCRLGMQTIKNSLVSGT